MIKDLEVRHCRALVAVHDSGGVGAAARALGVAQSTVSETLLSLERLLGTPVTLRRTGREAVLTAAAEALLPHARTLIAVSEAGLAAATRPGKAVIRLGTVESISSFLLPGPLSDFRLSWAEVEVRITIGLCEDLRKRVARSELDVALTIEGADRTPDRHVVEAFWPAQLRMIVAPHHALAQRVIERSDLEGRTCLLADPEGAFNELVRSWVGNTPRPPRLESAGSIDGVKRGVLSGDAIGVLPDYAVAEELAARSLVALETGDPPPQIALCLTARQAPLPGSALASLMDKVGAALDGR
ncbi:MAG: LysR family transcriptional regulator [Sphingomonas bacterium]|jgi:DNA-binding transcriptional LysR family regulator|uniref:LysR family transcriptional regulator n=1 Tax=Sphingomonas bacterium TaxID=1895847 RepID=UPI00262FC2E2|nr:LysR family transcriptional regulator [Sphingomonas bacterium]MDB5711934.1 LysR family transcriptional regulator [Sphingomonas bacterium]